MCVYVILPFPTYAKQVTVLWPHWDEAECTILAISAPFPKALPIAKASSTEQ